MTNLRPEQILWKYYESNVQHVMHNQQAGLTHTSSGIDKLSIAQHSKRKRGVVLLLGG